MSDQPPKVWFYFRCSDPALPNCGISAQQFDVVGVGVGGEMYAELRGPTAWIRTHQDIRDWDIAGAIVPRERLDCIPASFNFANRISMPVPDAVCVVRALWLWGYGTTDEVFDVADPELSSELLLCRDAAAKRPSPQPSQPERTP